MVYSLYCKYSKLFLQEIVTFVFNKREIWYLSYSREKFLFLVSWLFKLTKLSLCMFKPLVKLSRHFGHKMRVTSPRWGDWALVLKFGFTNLGSPRLWWIIYAFILGSSGAVSMRPAKEIYSFRCSMLALSPPASQQTSRLWYIWTWISPLAPFIQLETYYRLNQNWKNSQICISKVSTSKFNNEFTPTYIIFVLYHLAEGPSFDIVELVEWMWRIDLVYTINSITPFKAYKNYANI